MIEWSDQQSQSIQATLDTRNPRINTTRAMVIGVTPACELGIFRCNVMRTKTFSGVLWTLTDCVAVNWITSENNAVPSVHVWLFYTVVLLSVSWRYRYVSLSCLSCTYLPEVSLGVAYSSSNSLGICQGLYCALQGSWDNIFVISQNVYRKPRPIALFQSPRSCLLVYFLNVAMVVTCLCETV